MTLREITLPCCPKCGRVSKVPAGFGGAIKNACIGEMGNRHPKEKMIYVLFREVRNVKKED